MGRIIGVIAALLVVAFMVVVLAKGFGNDPHAVPFLLTGKPAPDFTVKRLDAEGVASLKDYRGKPVVLNFWATWCGPCKMEQPTLDFMSDKYRGQVQFIGVVFEDSEENTRKFLKDYGSTYVHLYDPNSTVHVDYGASGVPETYFISKEGIIVRRVPVPIVDPEEFEKYLQEIL
jgi:cytochrome c biogenesis protein CcmG, thiol:disulfide interchange protein DsbE